VIDRTILIDPIVGESSSRQSEITNESTIKDHQIDNSRLGIVQHLKAATVTVD
jgi:hypothetical protein